MLRKILAPPWVVDIPGTTIGFLKDFRVVLRDLDPADTHETVEYSCRISLCLAGHLHYRLTGSDRHHEFFLAEGQCALHCHPDQGRCRIDVEGEPARILEFMFTAADFTRLLGETPLGKGLVEDLQTGVPGHLTLPLSSDIHQALVDLRQALREPARGFAPLVLAKALEMVWFFTRAKPSPPCKPSGPGSRQAIAKACRLLEDHMAEPPGLETLAAEVGMSLSNFKRIFSQDCGMTPYAYLRQVRMERAQQLLTRDGLSVTEAAFAVGYSNLSHFSKAFAAYFGVKPSQVR